MRIIAQSSLEIRPSRQCETQTARGPTSQVRGQSGCNRSTVHFAQRQLCQSRQQVSTSNFQPQVSNQCTFQERGKLTAIQEAPYPIKPVPWRSTQPVGGKLRYHLTHWRKISDSNWMVQTARGYRLQLVRQPPSPHHYGSPNYL